MTVAFGVIGVAILITSLSLTISSNDPNRFITLSLFGIGYLLLAILLKLEEILKSNRSTKGEVND